MHHQAKPNYQLSPRQILMQSPAFSWRWSEHTDRNFGLSTTSSFQNHYYSKEVYTWCYCKPHLIKKYLMSQRNADLTNERQLFIVIYGILCCLVIEYEPAFHPGSFFLLRSSFKCDANFDVTNSFWPAKHSLRKTVLWRQNSTSRLHAAINLSQWRIRRVWGTPEHPLTKYSKVLLLL